MDTEPTVTRSLTPRKAASLYGRALYSGHPHGWTERGAVFLEHVREECPVDPDDATLHAVALGVLADTETWIRGQGITLEVSVPMGTDVEAAAVDVIQRWVPPEVLTGSVRAWRRWNTAGTDGVRGT